MAFLTSKATPDDSDEGLLDLAQAYEVKNLLSAPSDEFRLILAAPDILSKLIRGINDPKSNLDSLVSLYNEYIKCLKAYFRVEKRASIYWSGDETNLEHDPIYLLTLFYCVFLDPKIYKAIEKINDPKTIIDEKFLKSLNHNILACLNSELVMEAGLDDLIPLYILLLIKTTPKRLQEIIDKIDSLPIPSEPNPEFERFFSFCQSFKGALEFNLENPNPYLFIPTYEQIKMLVLTHLRYLLENAKISDFAKIASLVLKKLNPDEAKSLLGKLFKFKTTTAAETGSSPFLTSPLKFLQSTTEKSSDELEQHLLSFFIIQLKILQPTTEKSDPSSAFLALMEELLDKFDINVLIKMGVFSEFFFSPTEAEAFPLGVAITNNLLNKKASAKAIGKILAIAAIGLGLSEEAIQKFFLHQIKIDPFILDDFLLNKFEKINRILHAAIKGKAAPSDPKDLILKAVFMSEGLKELGPDPASTPIIIEVGSDPDPAMKKAFYCDFYQFRKKWHDYAINTENHPYLRIFSLRIYNLLSQIPLTSLAAFENIKEELFKLSYSHKEVLTFALKPEKFDFTKYLIPPQKKIVSFGELWQETEAFLKQHPDYLSKKEKAEREARDKAKAATLPTSAAAVAGAGVSTAESPTAAGAGAGILPQPRTPVPSVRNLFAPPRGFDLDDEESTETLSTSSSVDSRTPEHASGPATAAAAGAGAGTSHLTPPTRAGGSLTGSHRRTSGTFQSLLTSLLESTSGEGGLDLFGDARAAAGDDGSAAGGTSGPAQSPGTA